MSATEPPFPGCPCWCCLGDPTPLAWFDCAGELVATLVRHPITVLGALRTGDGASGLARRLIRVYQTRISAYRPARCPYVPSCSTYAAAAFERFGFRRGLALMVGRLWRCRTDVAWGTPHPLI
ncbi:membrane protein insertion efficiency factor YidD [Micromonospora auratinigra]|uniref:Putative membrane protein insertion efficiency factor n=1 Tax=Micromonospora auratinigra TaxID=261654 RepID=A0A1A9A0Z3_9ACTN|nr:membrane protein insertion efficiency factor YidD [Micromonospora auratinigra]SBT49810.1 putative membrane protein insertion efficiency factor [Micromonospora auratinigra]